MSEGFPTSPAASNIENPLMTQIDELQAQERLKKFVDHTNDQSVEDFKATQDNLGQKEGLVPAEGEVPENPLDKGLFEGDVFYQGDNQKVISVVGSRKMGDTELVRVTTEESAPYIHNGQHRAVREMTRDEAKAYIAASGANLIEGGYDRTNLDVTSNYKGAESSAANEQAPEASSPSAPETGGVSVIDVSVPAAGASVESASQPESAPANASQAAPEAAEGAGNNQVETPGADAYKAAQAEELQRQQNEQLAQGNPSAPEAQAAFEQLRAIAGRGNNKVATPGADAYRAAQEEARLSQRNDKLVQIDREVNGGELGEAYRNALANYAELKATSETKGRFGRRKRELVLAEAEKALFDAKLTLEKQRAQARKEQGLYEGDESSLKQQYSDDIFNGIRGLDGETRAATNNVLDQRMHDRGPFKRAIVKVGNFFTRGGKLSQWARTAGPGALVGFGVAATGAGIPVTTVVGIGLGLGIRKTAVDANLDKVRAENVDANGNAVTVMSDEHYKNLKDDMIRSGETNGNVANRVAQEIFGMSRMRGYEQADRARRDANKTMGRFALGYAAGGLAGNLLHSAINHPAGQGQQPTKPTHPTKPTNPTHPNGAGGGGHNAPGSNHNLPPNADDITRGEGWYHEFGDMGMTQDQAHILFNDHHVMDELVKAGAAYVDNSARIGGYGINMPASGHLSAQAVNIIESAMKAKGF